MQQLTNRTRTINSNPKVITSMSPTPSFISIKRFTSALFALVPLLMASSLFAQTTVNTATVARPTGSPLVLTCVNGPAGTGLSYASGAPANCSATDTDTLTPKLTVTKTASQTPFVVGKVGQTYTITIAIANGPTTAVTTLADLLPTGITLSAVPTATGGTMTGCPVTGGTLAGCSIAAGATNPITITVPVNVAATATTATNTATATGGGDPACTGTAPACTGVTPNIPVIDAVNDTANQPGGTVGATSNLATNDQFPVGSTFTIQPGSTCVAPVSVSTAGVATYTVPATGNCIVNYQVCAPAPNATVCDTAPVPLQLLVPLLVRPAAQPQSTAQAQSSQ
jgi:hypothetical protein